MRKTLVVILTLVSCGCAIQTPPINARNWPIEQHVAYYNNPSPLRVGLLPLADKRPPQEQYGQHPKGLFLLLWNRRVGDYYTGNQVFGDQTLNTLNDRFLNGLKATNTFAEIVPINDPSSFNSNNSEQIGRLARQHVVDQLIYCELEHFFGSQSQNTSIVLLPLYFINSMSWQDSKTLPWGKTAMACQVYGAQHGDMIWHHLIETNRTLPRENDSMAEAAMQSFVDAISQLSRELRELSLQPEIAAR